MKLLQRLTTLTVLSALLLTSHTLAQTAVTPSGSGISGDPYLIATIDNLYWITQNSGSWGAHFKQTATINASTTISWHSGAGFSPIGNNTTKFTGTYDGNGHAISGLHIDRSGGVLGLFGFVETGTIKNIGVISIGFNTSSSAELGGLAGALKDSNISNCYTTGAISGAANATVGGLIGSNINSTISNCYSTVSGGTGQNVGGLVGLNSGGEISDSYSTGNISGNLSGTTIYVGGLVGSNQSSGTVSNSYSTGNASSGYLVGGLVGFSAGTISNSYSRGDVSGSGTAGGLVGLNQSSVSKSYSTGDVDGSGSNFGGLVGTNQSIVNSDSFWDTATSGQSSSNGGTGKTTAEMTTSTTFTNVSWDFSDTWNIDSGINDGYPALLWQTEFGTVAPTAETEAATSVTSSSATINGMVNPGRESTVARFVYGTTSGTYTDSIDADQSSLNGWGEMSVSADLSGLTQGTTYYFRAAAENEEGYVRGSELSFIASEAPTISTGAATSISFTSATLSGDINSNGASNVVRFLYGTESETYTDSVVADQSPLTGSGSESVSADLSGLTQSQTYYVLVAAENSIGYERGEEVSFTTKTPPVLSAKPGSALSLVASSNQYVGVSANTSLDLTDGTIECWVKPAWTPGSLSANPAIVANRSSEAARYSIHIRNDMSAVDLWNGSVVGSINYTFSQGNWYHLVWVTEGSTSSLYINGNLIGTTTEVFSSSTGLPFSIGSNPSNESFEGQIDEVRLWNIPRTAQQIRENMHKTLVGTENGLVSYWQFNEGSGTATADSISFNHGTLQNGATWQTSTIPMGGGTSNSVSGFSNGTAAMGTVSLTTTDAFDSSVDITATQVDLSPNLLTEESVLLSDRYWVINTFGTSGTFSSDLTFTVPSGLTGAGTATASDFTLYRRSSTSEDSWTVAVDGASSVSDTEVTFAGITSFSQFMIGIDSLEQQITGSEGWRMLSVPVAGVSYGELLDTLWTQGFTGADTENGSSNVYTWAEVNREFQSISDAADTPEAGTGILVYVYDDQDFDGTMDGFPKTIRVDSIQSSGSISATLSYTAGTSDSVGWNLVGNPYGSTIDWNASSGWTQTNVDASFYIWNASAGEYQSHNGASGTLPNSLIAPWQGFWVKATAADPVLSLTDDVRSSGGALLKKQSVPELLFTLQETVDSLTIQSSQAMIMLHEQASTKKDRLDAYKLQPLKNEYLSLFSQLEDGTALDINALSAGLVEPLEIPLDYHFEDDTDRSVSDTAEFLLSWNLQNLPDDWSFTLHDNTTGKEIDLRDQSSLNVEHAINKFSKVSKTLEDSEDGNLSVPHHGVLSPKIIKAKKGESRTVSRFTITIIPGSAVSNEPEVAELPTKVELGQNYPNPFNPATTINFGLPKTGDVHLDVYNLLGQKVATLVNERRVAGTHTIRFDAQHLASGIYIYRLHTADKTITKKLTLIK